MITGDLGGPIRAGFLNVEKDGTFTSTAINVEAHENDGDATAPVIGAPVVHFLKILSYLLANKEVNGKNALAYFTDDNKIANAMVLADMELAASIAADTDVILFNIDSKSEMTGKQSKDAIVSVFLKVFNEMQVVVRSHSLLTWSVLYRSRTIPGI